MVCAVYDVAVVYSLSYVQLFATPWTAHARLLLSFTLSQSLLNFVFIESVMLSNLSSSAAPFSFGLNISQHQGLYE